MINRNLFIILLSTFTLSACAKTSNETQTPSTHQKNASPELQSKIQKLVEKTKKNMIFVEGGIFMMGDFGPLTRKDELPIVGLYAAMPAHKVTLDNFNLNAYKTTFDDFDIFTDSLGLARISMQEIAKKKRQPMAPAGIRHQLATSI